MDVSTYTTHDNIWMSLRMSYPNVHFNLDHNLAPTIVRNPQYVYVYIIIHMYLGKL